MGMVRLALTFLNQMGDVGDVLMIHHYLNRPGGQCEGLGRSFHVQRLMWASMVVKAYPAADDAVGTLQGLESVPLGMRTAVNHQS